MTEIKRGAIDEVVSLVEGAIASQRVEKIPREVIARCLEKAISNGTENWRQVADFLDHENADPFSRAVMQAAELLDTTIDTVVAAMGENGRDSYIEQHF